MSAIQSDGCITYKLTLHVRYRFLLPKVAILRSSIYRYNAPGLPYSSLMLQMRSWDRRRLAITPPTMLGYLPWKNSRDLSTERVFCFIFCLLFVMQDFTKETLMQTLFYFYFTLNRHHSYCFLLSLS